MLKNVDDNCRALMDYNGGFWAVSENGSSRLVGTSRYNFLSRVWFWIKDWCSSGKESENVRTAIRMTLLGIAGKIKQGEYFFYAKPESARINHGVDYYSLRNRVTALYSQGNWPELPKVPQVKGFTSFKQYQDKIRKPENSQNIQFKYQFQEIKANRLKLDIAS